MLDIVSYSKRDRHLLFLCLWKQDAKPREVSENTEENSDGVENKKNRERRDMVLILLIDARRRPPT